MEDMRTILMHMNAFDLLRVYVARDMGAPVDDKHLFPARLHFMRKDRAV